METEMPQAPCLPHSLGSPFPTPTHWEVMLRPCWKWHHLWSGLWQDVPCLDRGTQTPLESGCPDFLSSPHQLTLQLPSPRGCETLLTSSATCGPVLLHSHLSSLACSCSVWMESRGLEKRQGKCDPLSFKWNFVSFRGSGSHFATY